MGTQQWNQQQKENYNKSPTSLINKLINIKPINKFARYMCVLTKKQKIEMIVENKAKILRKNNLIVGITLIHMLASLLYLQKSLDDGKPRP
jgi:hypothetical protein